jgi:hypothetical protein
MRDKTRRLVWIEVSRRSSVFFLKNLREISPETSFKPHALELEDVTLRGNSVFGSEVLYSEFDQIRSPRPSSLFCLRAIHRFVAKFEAKLKWRWRIRK